MYVGVDVGGTKTLLAVLNDDGVIKEQFKFPTPQNYDHWLLEIRHALAHFKHQDFKAGAVGIAGRIDRKHGRRFKAGHLSWDNVPVQTDTERIFKCPIILENDAKLAGLSEYMLVKNDFNRVLYLTISTGVGFALIIDGVIDTAIGERGGTTVAVEHRGKLTAWEDFASGRAIVAQYGKKAVDIHDQATWKTIARNIASGLIEVIAITEPQIVVVGGSVGTYFDRFGDLLADELQKYQLPTIKMPRLKGAERPETAVIYGCYDLARQTYEHHYAKTTV